MLMWEEDLAGVVRNAAFRQLLATGDPATGEELATSIGLSLDKVALVLDELDKSGRIRRDDSARVIGSAGLSVAPDRHQIEMEGRMFWTWCAYDVLGIFGALRATGAAVSSSPATASSITLRFRDGRPEASGMVLFTPSDSYAACCTSIYEEWCPNSNFFEDPESAQAWSASHGLEGRILGLDEASQLATTDWLPLTRAPIQHGKAAGSVKIEVLHVSGCPHVHAARALLIDCLTEVKLDAAVKDKEGAYPSPTILVNGVDVMGAPAFNTAACRLDVPTRHRILLALRNT